jgi:hypothetical protein
VPGKVSKFPRELGKPTRWGIESGINLWSERAGTVQKFSENRDASGLFAGSKALPALLSNHSPLFLMTLPSHDPNPWFDNLFNTHVPRVAVVKAKEPEGDRMGFYSVRALAPVAAGDVLFVERALAYACEITLPDPAAPLSKLVAAEASRMGTALLQSVGRKGRAGLLELGMGVQDTCSLDVHSAPLEALADAICTANALPLQLNGSRTRYGMGLFQIASRVNHSCEPNSALLSHGPWIIFYATRALASGEEVTWTYMGEAPRLPLVLRRPALQKSVGFDCTCARCERELANPTVYTPEYWKVHEAAQRWRKMVYTKIGVDDEPTRSRASEYKLSLTFLEQHGANLRTYPLIESYVADALARLLVPIFPWQLFKEEEEARHWLALYRAAHPFISVYPDVVWHGALKVLLNSVTVYFMMRKMPLGDLGKVNYLPELPQGFAALGQFATDAYIFYDVDEKLPVIVRATDQLFSLLNNK